MLKLNFGSARQRVEGFKNVDISPKCQPDYLYDITQIPYPKEWEGCEEVRADNVFEHIEPKTLIKVINEIYRILKPGGRLWIRVPHITLDMANIQAAFRDPTHVNYFTTETFTYWDKDHKRSKWISGEYGIIPWKLKRNEAWRENPIFLIVELIKE